LKVFLNSKIWPLSHYDAAVIRIIV
jgi:hypothetical protein